MQEFKPQDVINNRYKVIRKLGAGAMGAVYLCADSAEKNIKVALKVLISENLDDQDVWAKGEYEALTRLRHPNLARVHNFGRIEGTDDYFIVSEFIKGVDLYSATEYLNYDEMIDIVVQICRSLEYIHSQGYVHFDVKPDNLLVSRTKTVGIKEGSKVEYNDADFNTSTRGLYDKPVVKLIDFGLAEKITGSFSFAIKGTLNYLAPEILNGSTPDRRADLYSLGVTIYQVVNRDLPFHQDVRPFGGPSKFDTRANLFEANMKKHPEYLRELIMRLLEENPDDRFQSAKELIQFVNRHSNQSFELETEETRASYFYSPRLVGRKREMNLLKKYQELIFFPHRSRSDDEETEEKPDQSAEDATDSIPVHCVLVTGEMGSGKSRLVEEFQHYCKLNDINLYKGNCYEGSQKAYQPIIEILRELVCQIGPNSELFRKHEQYILKLLPDLGGDREFDSGPDVTRPVKDKQHFIERISQFLMDVAEKHPYLFCINNLHWADDASIDLLERLFERMQETVRKGKPLKLLALATQRSEEQHSERTKELFSAIKDSGFCLEIPVRRLKRLQIQEFLQSMLGITDVPSDFAAQLEEQTGGNPLFLVETLKALEDEGIIKHQADGWSIKTTKYSRVEIPHRMEDLLQKRISKIEEGKRQILEVMAVLNKPVSPKFLQRFKRFTQAPILVQLRDLETAGIVHKLFENGKLHFEIEQPKVREILYSNLSEEPRQAYHGEVGAAFEDEYRYREEEILEELAYHYQRSDRAERAMEFAVRAGDRLKAIYANERAFEYYLYVLEEVADQPEYVNVYFDIREKLADLCMIMGRYDAAEEHYTALLMTDTRDMLSPDRVTTLYLRLGKVSEVQGDYDRALHCYKDARNFLSTVGGKDEKILDRARVYNSIGWVYVCMGKYEKAMTISLEALRVIQNETERIEHAMIYSTIGSANYFKGNIKEAIKYHQKSLDIKEHLEDIPEIVRTLNNLGEAYLVSSEYGDSWEHFRRALGASEEIGDPYGRAMTMHNLANLYYAVGDLDEADRYLEHSIEQSKAYNMRFLSLRNYLVRGMVLTERREYSKAEGNFFRVLTAYSKQGNRAGLCSTLLSVAKVHRLNANPEEARAMAEEARRYAEELGIQSLKARWCLEDSRLLRMSGGGSCQEALERLEEGIRLAAKLDDPEFLGELHFELAEVLVTMREVSKASQHYRMAEERIREVLECLPAEFRESYEALQCRRFPNWPRAKKVFSPGASRPSGEEETASERVEPEGREPGEPLAVTAEESLKRVGQLMQTLPASESLASFLGDLLREVLETTSARAGYILSLSGRNLSVIATRNERENDERPGKLLCLGLIDRVFKSQQPLVVGQVEDHPEIAELLRRTEIDCDSLAIFPFLEPDGKKGVLYLLDPDLFRDRRSSGVLLIQPLLNLIPVSYLHFRSQATQASSA
ncbi:MAG: tetratricopeptide repeat protein [Planctomycetota bacterium]|nr:tetratricopeptide repeat protein [Planctomycetota bacterium]